MKLMPNDKPLHKDHREVVLDNGKLVQKGKELPFKVVSATMEYGGNYTVCCIESKDFDYHKEYFTIYDGFDAYYVPYAQVLSAKVSSLTGNIILLECKEII